MDNHLAVRPPLQLIDRDDTALYIGVKVELAWLRKQPEPTHTLLLAILGQMTLPPAL